MTEENSYRPPNPDIPSPLKGDIFIKRHAAVCGGISWPVSYKSPAYICILGQSYYDSNAMNNPTEDNVHAGPRFLIVESESREPSLLEFWERVIILAKQSLCKSFYSYMPTDRLGEGYLKDFYRIATEQNATVHLCDDQNNFEFGFSKIVNNIINGSVIIPSKSIVGKQLLTITSRDLKHNPERSFYAISALGHIFSNFAND